MSWLDRIFRRHRLYNDLSDEIREHLEERVEELVSDGVARDEARNQARREFGNVELLEERGREAWSFPNIESILADVRFAFRMLRKAPVVTAVAVLSLALGIGANTAIFGLIDTVLLRMLPVQHPEELVALTMTSGGEGGGPDASFTNPIWEAVRDRQDVFSGVFAWAEQTYNMADGGEARNVRGIIVSGEYFSTLGLQPALGRLLSKADDQRGCAGGAVLSYPFWQTHYGGAQSVTGESIRLNRHSFPIVGVAPSRFFGTSVGAGFDVAIPLCAEPLVGNPKQSALDARSWWWLRVMGRRKPEFTVAQITARMNALAPQIFQATVPQKWPAEMQSGFLKRGFEAQEAGPGVSDLREQYTSSLKILMDIVGLVLLIACANIASLMLARGVARRREMGVRISLGASRHRVVRQVLTESLVLAACGAALGLLLAPAGSRLVVRLVSTQQNPVVLDLFPHPRVLAFTAAVTVLTALLFGLLPALRATRLPVAATVKGLDSGGNERLRAGRWIVAVQVMLSLVLLAGSGLLIRSFRNLLTLDAGFDRSNVLLVHLDLSHSQVGPEARPAAYDDVLRRLKALPGAAGVAQSWTTPIGNSEWNEEVEANGKKLPGQDRLMWFNWITPEYLNVLRTPVLRGRDFSDADTATSQPVALINEAAAKHFFPGQEAIGRYFTVLDASMTSSKPLQIVGVVKDAKYSNLKKAAPPTAYIPAAQAVHIDAQTTVEIRYAGEAGALIPAVRDAVASVSRGATVRFETLSEQVGDALRQDRLLATLSGFFGAIALLLTAIGLYGAMAYNVSGRTHEIGIRMAIGAQKAAVLRLVMADALMVLAAGVVGGVLGSLWAARLLQQLLFGLKFYDPGTLIIAVVALAVVAIAATMLPARRAMKVDPVIALKYE